MSSRPITVVKRGIKGAKAMGKGVKEIKTKLPKIIKREVKEARQAIKKVKRAFKTGRARATAVKAAKTIVGKVREQRRKR